MLSFLPGHKSALHDSGRASSPGRACLSTAARTERLLPGCAKPRTILGGRASRRACLYMARRAASPSQNVSHDSGRASLPASLSLRRLGRSLALPGACLARSGRASLPASLSLRRLGRSLARPEACLLRWLGTASLPASLSLRRLGRSLALPGSRNPVSTVARKPEPRPPRSLSLRWLGRSLAPLLCTSSDRVR